jgi:hypothetical protein
MEVSLSTEIELSKVESSHKAFTGHDTLKIVIKIKINTKKALK